MAHARDLKVARHVLGPANRGLVGKTVEAAVEAMVVVEDEIVAC